jgi:threonine 3-dehydrogenase
MYETWYKLTQMLRSGLDISAVLTHQLPLDDYATAFAAMRDGQCGKIVLDIAGAAGVGGDGGVTDGIN